MRNMVRIGMAAAAVFLLTPASVSGACRESTESGGNVSFENGNWEELSPAGMELWKDAQEKQRQLTEIEAELEGSWSVTLFGLKIGEQFSGTACFENLGEEHMTGRVGLTDDKGSREYLFRDRRILERENGGEQETVFEPEEWTVLTEELADRTTYNLDYVKSLQAASLEDGGTELSYELDRKRTAEWTEPVLREAFSEKGLSLPEGTGWLTLDMVKGDLTINNAGYMAVDRLWACGSAASGSWKADLEFGICIKYKEK